MNDPSYTGKAELLIDVVSLGVVDIQLGMLPAAPTGSRWGGLIESQNADLLWELFVSGALVDIKLVPSGRRGRVLLKNFGDNNIYKNDGSVFSSVLGSGPWPE